MPEAEIGKAVQLLDLMLEFFTDDAHWTRGRYDDGHGGHCLVGALMHLSREHRLPSAPAIALLQDAMPRPGLPLVHFNDNRCGTVAELRSVIVKARRLAHDTAERERAAAAVKAWLLAQIEKKQAARGDSVVCYLNNATAERTEKVAGHAATRVWPRLRGRRLSAVAAARSHRKSPEKLMCSQLSGDAWASHASGTDCSVARRWAMASAM